MKNNTLFTRIKTTTLVLVCCLQFCLAPAVTVYASPDWPAFGDELDSLSGIVIDADSGTVLYEKEADTLYPPASTTKILTALIVLENCQDLDDIVTFSKTAIDNVEWDSGNKLGVVEGDRLTVRDCLYSLLLCSSNQSANALAEYIAGDMDSFVQMMNDKVRELGLTDTKFQNPSGLNGDEQRVTARELALIAKAAYDNPALLDISKTLKYTIPPLTDRPDGQTIENEHRLVTNAGADTHYPPAIAGKPGYLRAAGNTAITYAELDGRRLITVVLKGTKAQYFIDCKKMFEFGFADFENHKISVQDAKTFSAEELEYFKDQNLGSSDLSVSDSVTITLPKDTSPGSTKRHLTPLPAGRHPDNAVALLEYTYQEKVVGKTYVINLNYQPETEPQPDSTGQTDSPAGDNGKTAAADNTDRTPVKKVNGLLIFFIILMVLVAAGAGGSFYLFRQKEQQRMDERQKKRRMRLEEMGISQEEFEEMKKIRKQKKQNDDKEDGS